MIIDEKHIFPKAYSWKILPGFPVNTVVLNFPPEVRPYSEGLVIKLETKTGKTWVGNFHGISVDYLSGIFSTPRVDTVCIICEGRGFMVNVDEPHKTSDLPLVPIVNFHYPFEGSKILFESFTDLACYGANGLLWQTRVSCDGIQVKEIANGFISGFAWDSAKGKYVNFRIDAETGELSGGACPI